MKNEGAMHDEVLQVAWLFASPTRLAAYRAVGETGLGVLEVAALLGIAPSSASRHLRLLDEGGLVRVKRQGHRRVYKWATKKWFVSSQELDR
jgi:DNA-binding transcriptional ArsR family regulator